MSDLIRYHGDSKVINRLCELVNNMTSINFEVVQTLPTQDISTSTIYLVPKQTAQTDNIYDEYINTDGTSQGWELIGTTEIDLSNYVQFSDLSAVATSGDYDDLIDKPTIPTTLSQLSDDSTHRLVTDTEKSTWSGKANTSDIKDGTLTIQLNGTTEETFTANSSTNKTANIKAVDWISNGILGAKNIIPYPHIDTTLTENGVDWTDNKDGSWTANNKATSNSNIAINNKTALKPIHLDSGKYILSGCQSGGSNSSYNIWIGIYYDSTPSTLTTIGRDYGDGLEFTLTEGGYLNITLNVIANYTASNVLFKPMLRLATDSDNTYQFYSQTNVELTKDKYEVSVANKLGAKNLLVYPFKETTHTDNGVAFTDNGDGTVKANNQATGNAIFTFCNKYRNFRLSKGTYRISGCPSGASASTHNIWVGVYYDSAPDTLVTVARDYGDGATFTLTENAIINVNWNVMSGYNPNNAVCKPMIRVFEDTDDTWQPYAMTNKQLTDIINNVPTSAGTYTLQATVDASGNVTYSWV